MPVPSRVLEAALHSCSRGTEACSRSRAEVPGGRASRGRGTDPGGACARWAGTSCLQTGSCMHARHAQPEACSTWTGTSCPHAGSCMRTRHAQLRARSTWAATSCPHAGSCMCARHAQLRACSTWEPLHALMQEAACAHGMPSRGIVKMGGHTMPSKCHALEMEAAIAHRMCSRASFSSHDPRKEMFEANRGGFPPGRAQICTGC